MLTTTIDCTSLNKKISTDLPSGLKILFTTMASVVALKPNVMLSQDPVFIPHSIFFDFENDFSDKNSTFSNMMNSNENLQISIRKLGLNLNDEIVVYDDFGNFCASRVWFMLFSMGFTNVKTLEGGLPLWLEFGFNTQSTTVHPDHVSDVELSPSTLHAFVDASYILSTLNNNNQNTQNTQILDARSYGRYAGTEPEPRANMRSGHIPKSISMYYTTLLTDGCFKPVNVLSEIFNNKNVQLDNEIITSCGSGITACILAQAAISLGARSIKVYDASWSQWGADHSLPIEVVAHD
jgi:thiosulfate/3-mercaptopyruvate sulfurtransferase